MEIRRLTDTARSPLAPRLAPGAAGAQPAPGREGGAGDRYEGRPPAPDEADVPFWLVAMATDRMAKRRYLSDRDRKAAQKREGAWVKAIAAAARPAITAWAASAGPAPDLAAWQALAEALSLAAGGFPPPRAVWQPNLRDGRGQFLFRVEGNLLQLKPGAPGSRSEWTATVAHETFHHLQQCLVTALYRGEPALEGELAELAGLYRDARNVYETLGAHCPPARHRRQELELGAWAFGEAIARSLPPA